ncbi:MAG: pteridine-dependent deoxygenase [Gammaproteobacteria bacterium]
MTPDDVQGEPLTMRYERARVDELLEDEDLLAVLEFGTSPLGSGDPRHVPVALEPLRETGRVETWRVRGPVETGRLGDVRFARGLDLTMGQIALDVAAGGGIRAASRRAYEQLEAFLARSQHPWPQKIWNYVPGINDGEGDGECYRQFCVGRAEALAAHYDDQPLMPAATAIGVDASEPALQVYFLAGALPGLNVENPRQVNAWRYPRRYGPRSPLFSRGTIVDFGHRREFLISGTASVIGHETRHVDDVRRQTEESWRNVTSLLQEGRRLLGQPEEAAPDPALLKVYVRDPEDADTIAATLERHVKPEVPRIFVRGDICRQDLLTEMDGVLSLGAPPAA